MDIKNFKREVLFVYDYTEQGMLEAYAKEAEIVNDEWIKRDDNYNLVKGGRREGSSENKEKTIYQFDLAGNLLRVWKSITLASFEFQNQSAAKTAIWNVCNKKSKSAYGYYWSYKNKFDYVPNGHLKAVAMYNDAGEFLECFNSIKEASIRFHVSDGNIHAAIKGKQKHCAGYRWRYFYGNRGNIKPLK